MSFKYSVYCYTNGKDYQLYYTTPLFIQFLWYAFKAYREYRYTKLEILNTNKSIKQ